MNLRALATLQPAALPSLEDPVLRSTLLRPGERHEAIPLPEVARAAIASEAQRCGVSIDLAAALLIEARLVMDWLASVGQAADAVGQCDQDAAVLSAAEADYLRALTVGRRRDVTPAAAATAAVPVRLVARCSDAVLERAARDDLELAIRWETGAMRSALGMGEWAIRSTFAGNAEPATRQAT